MKHGDFTELAKYYVGRPGYSIPLLTMIKSHVAMIQGESNIKIADVGAGTGKLTECLVRLGGISGYAVEPNDAMREEGIKAFSEIDLIRWSKGTAEETNLPDNCVDWVLMGSSFHWTDVPKAMAEFHRILKPGGFFTAIWNPRDIERSPLHNELEEIIYSEVPNMKRVSSGKSQNTYELQEKMCGNGMFDNIVCMEAPHVEKMTIERYMNIWKSVNDIRVQAGEEGFARILSNIEKRLEGMDHIEVPYLSRSWTVQSKS